MLLAARAPSSLACDPHAAATKASDHKGLVVGGRGHPPQLGPPDHALAAATGGRVRTKRAATTAQSGSARSGGMRRTMTR